MYTDFTGAAMYLTGTEKIFDFSGLTGFDPSKRNQALRFRWYRSVYSKADAWSSIRFEMKCYSDNPDSVAYSVVSDKIPASGDKSDPGVNVVELKSVELCAPGKRYSKVAIRLTQVDNTDTLLGVGGVTLSFDQM